ncbi:MAG: zinc dependent phospholipase C family protein [Bdellovibrionia bacterium]
MKSHLLLISSIFALFHSLMNVSWGAGITTHMFMADEAIEYIKDPEFKEFLRRNQNTMRNGSIFPDSGYIWHNSYGEFAHWDEFHNGYAHYLDQLCQMPLSPRCEDLFAFFLGTLSHGLSDVYFHRDFISEVSNRDFNGNYQAAHDYSDRGIDMLSIIDYGRGLVIPSKHFLIEDVKKIFTLCGKDFTLFDLKVRTNTLYAALLGERLGSPISYAYYKYKSNWAQNNYFFGKGGVMDSAQKIAIVWEKAWEKVVQDQGFSNMAQFRLEGNSFPDIEIMLD